MPTFCLTFCRWYHRCCFLEEKWIDYIDKVDDEADPFEEYWEYPWQAKMRWVNSHASTVMPSLSLPPPILLSYCPYFLEEEYVVWSQEIQYKEGCFEDGGEVMMNGHRKTHTTMNWSSNYQCSGEVDRRRVYGCYALIIIYYLGQDAKRIDWEGGMQKLPNRRYDGGIQQTRMQIRVGEFYIQGSDSSFWRKQQQFYY